MKKSRRYLTLIEIMIVMFLISSMIGVLAYNYQKSLDESKAFKTKMSIDRIETALLLALSTDGKSEDWKTIVRNSQFIKDGEAVLKDGWGNEFEVVSTEEGLKVVSERYNSYINKHPESLFK